MAKQDDDDDDISFFVEDTIGLCTTKTLTIRASLNDTIKSVHEQILFLTKIPVTRQKLVYEGKELYWSKTLKEYSIRNGHRLRLKSQTLECMIQAVANIPTTTQKFLNDYRNGKRPDPEVALSVKEKEIMEHLRHWEVVDHLVSFVCGSAVCEVSGGLAWSIRSYIDLILYQPQPDDLRILIYASVPATLYMLFHSDLSVYEQIPRSALEKSVYKQISLNAFKYLFERIVSLPQQLHAECLPILLESCNYLRMFVDLKVLCRGPYLVAVKRLLLEDSDKKFLDNFEAFLKWILPIISELANRLCSFFDSPSQPPSDKSLGLSAGSRHLLSAHKIPSHNLASSSQIEEDVLWLVNEFKASSSILRREYDKHVEVRNPRWTAWLHDSYKNLSEVMESCLEKVESHLSSNNTFELEKQTQYSLCLFILEELYLISRLCKDNFWKTFKLRNYAISWLIVRYAEREHDYAWILKHKGIGDSTSRALLVSMNFPKAKEPDTHLFENLIHWAKLLDDSFFFKFKNQEESEFISHFDRWLTLFCQAIFNPENSLFVRSLRQRKEFYPNPELVIQPFHLKCFKFAGKIIALAVLHQVDTGVVIDRVFMVNLVGKNLSLEDIKDADPELYETCRKILQLHSQLRENSHVNKLRRIEKKALTDEFNYRCVMALERCKQRKQNHQDTEDKEKFVKELIHHRFVSLISLQVESFKKGLSEVLGEPTVELLKWLDPDDLDWILHKRKRTRPVVDEILYKDYNHNYDEGDRLMYRYKQNAVRGRKITAWDTVELLGKGSCGSVYKGIAADGSIFAVKQVPVEEKENETEEEKRRKKLSIQLLDEEMNSLCQLSHPNIVKYLGTHRDELKLCVFLELVGNGSLVDIYKKYELKESQISSYTKSILEGLNFLHDQKVVHRDIKCANILVADDGRVKLADFGLAKAIESHPGFKSYAGTLAWMAPEFFNENLREGDLIQTANDIWSFGCTVLEMYIREAPYAVLGLTREQLKSRLGRGELPPIPPDLSVNAKNFIMSCLQVRPSKRATAAQLLQHPFVNSAAPSDDSFFHKL